MAKRDDVPQWEDAVNGIGAVISYINERLHSGGKGMCGKTPDRVFEENLPADVRRADRKTLRMALSKGELRTVRNNMVRIGDNKYYHPGLVNYSGRQVVVRSMLVTDTEVQICDLDGRFLFTATSNVFFEGGDLSSATERLRRAQKLNIMRLAEMGTGEAGPAPEYETMVEVALNKYRQAEPFNLNKYLGAPEKEGLPPAAGAEAGQVSFNAGPSAPDKPKRVLINPLDVKLEDVKPK
ncbi:MAG: Mu transposase C-terminal domain-containing protein [Treponema sp.]|nr:Mu transposase C-terminal domain-containing protein [Treponema sp.]